MTANSESPNERQMFAADGKTETRAIPGFGIVVRSSDFNKLFADYAAQAERIAQHTDEMHRMAEQVNEWQAKWIQACAERDTAQSELTRLQSKHDLALETIRTQQMFLQALANEPSIRARVLEAMEGRDAARTHEARSSEAGLNEEGGK